MNDREVDMKNLTDSSTSSDNSLTSISCTEDPGVIVYEKPSFVFCDEHPSGKLGANNCCSKC